MERRNFILSIISILPANGFLRLLAKNDNESITHEIFEKIINKAKNGNWHKLSIGNLIIEIAKEFINTPYVANTLEGEPEICRVNFNGLDCVTFFENALCLARIIKKRYFSLDKLLDEVTYTRYRNGIITDYTSRLHYTSEWIIDNIKKNVMKDITKVLGGISIRFNLNFMSQNPHFYKPLIYNPDYIQIIREIEQTINKFEFYYIPNAEAKKIENKLSNGDIVAILTNKKGLDYSHIGLNYRMKNQSRFLHASSKLGRVLIDTSISDYLKNSKNSIGITILRPLDL